MRCYKRGVYLASKAELKKGRMAEMIFTKEN